MKNKLVVASRNLPLSMELDIADDFAPSDPDDNDYVSEKGGDGSGHWGHVGRPGLVGGSKPKEGSLGGIASGKGMIIVAHETSNLDDLKMLVSQGMRRDFKPRLNFEGDYAPGKGLDREGTYVSSPEKLSGGYGRYTVELEVSRDEIGVPGEMTALGHGQTDEDIDVALNESTLGAVTIKDIDPDRIVRIREYDPITHKTTTHTRDEFLRKYKLTKIGKLPGAREYREILQKAVGRGLVLESMVDQELENYLRANLEDKAYLVDDLSVSLKGGEGSGHWGHIGRPGLVGGSVPKDETASFQKLNVDATGYPLLFDEFPSLDELGYKRGIYNEISFWVLPDGRLMFSTRPIYHTGIAYAEILAHRKDYPRELVSAAIQNSDTEKSEFYENEDIEKYFENLGWQRVQARATPEVSVLMSSMKPYPKEDIFDVFTFRLRKPPSKALLRRIQSMYDSGTLPRSTKAIVMDYTDEYGIAHTDMFQIAEIMVGNGFERGFDGRYTIKQDKKRWMGW